MDTQKVLVDSSVWIDFFKGKQTELFDELLTENMVSTNELILSELLPILQFKKQTEIIEGLLALPLIPVTIDWCIIREMQLENIKNGVKKVGIPDLIILQQVIQKKLHFLSFDKHFKLMKHHFDFTLL